MGRLEGKVIVLTAAAQGIGRASALVSSRLRTKVISFSFAGFSFSSLSFFFPCFGFLLIFLSCCSLELNRGPQAGQAHTLRPQAKRAGLPLSCVCGLSLSFPVCWCVHVCFYVCAVSCKCVVCVYGVCVCSVCVCVWMVGVVCGVCMCSVCTCVQCACVCVQFV